MKNKLSLASILGIILLSITIFGGVVASFLVKRIFREDEYLTTDQYFFLGFLFFTVLLFFIALGILYKTVWARTLLLWYFYLAIVATTLMLSYNISDLMRNEEAFSIGSGMTAFAYCFYLEEYYF